MKHAKTPALKRFKRLEIARYKRKFPAASIREIADTFEVTYNQARTAIIMDSKGELLRVKPRQKPGDVIKIKESDSADNILEKQYHHAAAQLESDMTIAVDQRIEMLGKMFFMRKTLQQVRLQNHIRRTDAGILAVIVRRYNPDATDEDIIAIYHEALEIWKREQI
jgi:hypothetical protein